MVLVSSVRAVAPAARRIGPLDLGVALLAAIVPAVRMFGTAPERDTLLDLSEPWRTAAIIVPAVTATAALVVRSRRPLAAAAVCVAVGVLWALVGYQGPAASLPAAVAVHAVALRSPQKTALVASLGAGIVLTGASLAAVAASDASSDTFVMPQGGPPAIVSLLMIGLATAIGLWQRSRRALEATFGERIERIEAAREHEARSRIAEDRLRIARDLHDVIAHHMAVISVQSAAAEHLVDTDAPRARESLQHVRRSARTVLDELSTVLDVLRAGGAPVRPAGDAERVGGLAGLEQLVDGFRSSGVAVTLEQSFDGAVADGVELVVYRVVQEALTNAFKHAPGAHVAIAIDGHGDDVVRVRVRNARPALAARPGGGSGVRAAGYGLVGMRERVARAGGAFAAHPDGEGGYLVEAVLPAGGRAAREGG